MAQAAAFRLAVDIGGTFTDVVLQGPDQSLTTTKVLTTAQAPEQGVLEGVLQLLHKASIKAADIGLLIHGTTLATNALIERKGAKTAFLTTAGFRDILEMGFEKRYAHYDLKADRPQPLVPRTLRFTVPERMRASGETLVALDESTVRAVAAILRQQQIEALAIGFLHAYAHPQHEQRAAQILAEELPQITLCLSSEVCPEMREYERFSTTCANAYVRPLMAGYLGRLRTLLDEAGLCCPLYLMMSGGGLTTLEQAMAFPIRLVESGPAGGAVFAAQCATQRQIDKALAFDMGGTTAKMCLIDEGQPQRSRRFEIARVYRDMKGSGLPVRIPVIEMVEIGAGGGSIARVDALGQISVGPDSAGSEPGPVAYAHGGTEPTVTDANVMLGKLDAQYFAAGRIALDPDAAAAVLERSIGKPLELTEYWPAVGVVEIVEENMANAARVHAIERGQEAAEYTLIAFGGAAPLHAARLAEKLGIQRVVVPLGAGVGSAIGFLQAPMSYQVVRSFRSLLQATDLTAINRLITTMIDEAQPIVEAGAQGAIVKIECQLELRYCGQGHELAIELPSRTLQSTDLDEIRQRFETLYHRIYGLTMPDIAIEAVSWSVTATTVVADDAVLAAIPAQERIEPSAWHKMYDSSSAAMIEAAWYWRQDLPVGARISGPALIAEDETSTVIPGNFSAWVDRGGALVLQRYTEEIQA